MKRSRNGSFGLFGSMLSTCQYAAVNTSAQDNEDAKCAACAACDISMILPRTRAACSFSAAASIGAVVVRTATFIVLSSHPLQGRWSSRFVFVFGRQLRNVGTEALGPGNHIIDALLERERIAPAKCGAQFEAVQPVRS